MLLFHIILIASFIVITLYRMWLNAQIYRIMYDFHEPIDPKAKNMSAQEINRMNESSLIILFCFFTFFWFGYKASYKSYQVKSNIMMVLSIMVIVIFVYLVLNENLG